MTKLAPEWVRTSDPVIRSPARYRWTTAPARHLWQNHMDYDEVLHMPLKSVERKAALARMRRNINFENEPKNVRNWHQIYRGHKDK